MSINIKNTTILNICRVDYQCNIDEIDKSKAINLLKNTDLTKGRGVLSK